MKKFILAIGSVLTLVACNQVPPQSAGTTSQPQVQQTIDTAGLSSFRQWKVQNELADVSEYQARQDNQSAVASKPATRKEVTSPSRNVSRNSSPVSKRVEQPQTSAPDNSVSKTDEGGAGTGTANSGTGETTTPSEKKEGWSKAAKGAVIGGVTGAAGGAVINKKNRVVGAVVGAVIGAGGGYAIGRGMDKKDGRIEID